MPLESSLLDWCTNQTVMESLSLKLFYLVYFKSNGFKICWWIFINWKSLN